MAYKNIKKKQGKDFSFYEKVPVNWSQFGNIDGYTVEDGYGPDLVIPFSTQGLTFINEGTVSSQTVEVSFNGSTIHLELDPSLPSRTLTFTNRVQSLIWFRLKSGSTGPVNISVIAWAVR